jgi:hypothetical protein
MFPLFIHFISGTILLENEKQAFIKINPKVSSGKENHPWPSGIRGFL